jgi:hypothetical protein
MLNPQRKDSSFQRWFKRHHSERFRIGQSAQFQVSHFSSSDIFLSGINPITAQVVGNWNITPAGYRGVMVTFKAGTVSGTSPTLTLNLQVAIGALSDGSIAWASTSAVAMSTGGVIRLILYPDTFTVTIGGLGGTIVNGAIPLNWRVLYTPGGTTPSIQANEIYFDYLI